MTASSAILYALTLSICLIVFSLGARETLDDALILFRRPAALARALIAIFVVVPAFAIAMALILPLAPHARFALVALAVSPLPPILPKKEMKVGGDRSYAVGLLVAVALFSVGITPLLADLALNLLGSEARISFTQVARPLLISIALPLAAGMILRRFAPRVAEELGRYASLIGTTFLLVGAVLILVHAWRPIVGLIGDGTVLVFASAVVVGLAAGHLLGGKREGDSASLALAAATRHPGIAVAIASTSFPDEQRTAAAAVLLFLLTNLVVTLPYIFWVKARTARVPGSLAHGVLATNDRGSR